ncbi:MAG TPA: pilus (MSHA type) biogenesis protein MshL [Gammaproteobacteria bacterium]|nr:pilus (MSHA type) biogenesis protein MshL [Gammaproteobacteria bacterium]
MKGRRNFWRVVWVLGCLSLVGCVAHAKRGTPQDNIMTALNTDMATDNALARKANSPTDINQALLQSAGKLPTAAGAVPTAEKRFDISVRNAPAKSFFLGLVSGTPYNMVVSPDISGTVSLDLKDVTIEEALDAVRDIYGYDYQTTAYGYEVLPPTLQTKIFSVNYLDIQRDGHSNVNLSTGEVTSVGSQNSGSSSSSGGGSSTPASGGSSAAPPSGSQIKSTFKSDFWANLQTTLQTMVGTDGGRSIVVNPQAGIVMVRGFPKDLRTVAQYLDTIQNHMNRQVILEAEILEVTLNDNYQAGINWRALNLTQGNLNTGAINSNPSSNYTNPFATASTLATAPFAVFHSGSNSTNFQSLIDLLETQGNVQVLSSPRVSTVNNQQAVIKVGTESFFVTNVTSNVTPSSGSNTTSSSVTLTPFFSGITLDVTPQISHVGEVVLHVHPSISKVTTDIKSVNLGSQGTLQLPLAQSVVRESDDIVRAKNGQVIVIGGMMSHDTSEVTASTPGLSRIPFFGALFRSPTQSSDKTELVILLRPVVPDTHTWADQLHKSAHEFKQVNRGYHVGSRPEIFGTEGEVND